MAEPEPPVDLQRVLDEANLIMLDVNNRAIEHFHRLVNDPTVSVNEYVTIVATTCLHTAAGLGGLFLKIVEDHGSDPTPLATFVEATTARRDEDSW